MKINRKIAAGLIGAVMCFSGAAAVSADVYTSGAAKVEPTTVSSTKNAVKLSWRKFSGAQSYHVYRYDSRMKVWNKASGDIKGTSFKTKSNIKPQGYYRFKVVPVKNGRELVNSESRTVRVGTKPLIPSLKVNDISMTSAVIHYNTRIKVKDSYDKLNATAQIQSYSVSRKKWVTYDYKPAASVEGGKITIRNLAKGSTYKFRVRTVVPKSAKTSGKTFTSDWNEITFTTRKS